MSAYIFSIFRPGKEPTNFTDSLSDGEMLERSTVRRGWLLVLVLMLAFIALTRIFPNAPVSPDTPSQQLGGASTGH